MSYSFEQDVKNLKDFYKHTIWGYQSLAGLLSTSPLNSTVSSGAQFNPVTQFQLHDSYFKQMVPVMICMIWENFVIELKHADLSKYSQHCKGSYKKWFNTRIREIACIRDCIVHRNSTIDNRYLSESPIKQYPIGFRIVIEQIHIDGFFADIENAFKIITT